MMFMNLKDECKKVCKEILIYDSVWCHYVKYLPLYPILFIGFVMITMMLLLNLENYMV